MTEPEFWKLIEDTQDELTEVHDEKLVAALRKLSLETVLGFGYWWDVLKARAYDWKLWGAAYLINGGCSDDGFLDFRTWLILEGEKVYTAALADPDSLAKTNVRADEAGYQCYPAHKVFEDAKTGKDYYTTLEGQYGEILVPEEPSGEQWDFEDQDENEQRLPKLFKKFGDA